MQLLISYITSSRSAVAVVAQLIDERGDIKSVHEPPREDGAGARVFVILLIQTTK